MAALRSWISCQTLPAYAHYSPTCSQCLPNHSSINNSESPGYGAAVEERQGGSHITHSHEPALSLSLHALSGMLCASASSKPPYKYVLPDVGFTGWVSLTPKVSEMFFFFCLGPPVIWRSQIVAGCCCASTTPKSRFRTTLASFRQRHK